MTNAAQPMARKPRSTSARGYDLLDDAIDFDRHVIPIVREGVAERDTARAAA